MKLWKEEPPCAVGKGDRQKQHSWGKLQYTDRGRAYQDCMRTGCTVRKFVDLHTAAMTPTSYSEAAGTHE